MGGLDAGRGSGGGGGESESDIENGAVREVHVDARKIFIYPHLHGSDNICAYRYVCYDAERDSSCGHGRVRMHVG
jgi:hypothetical protein